MRGIVLVITGVDLGIPGGTVPVVVLLMEIASAGNNGVIAALPGQGIVPAQHRIVRGNGLPWIIPAIQAGSVTEVNLLDFGQVEAQVLRVENAVLIHVPGVELIK